MGLHFSPHMGSCPPSTDDSLSHADTLKKKNQVCSRPRQTILAPTKTWPMAGDLLCHARPTSWPPSSMEQKVRFNRKEVLKGDFEIHITFRGLAAFSWTQGVDVETLLFFRTDTIDHMRYGTFCLVRAHRRTRGEQQSGRFGQQVEETGSLGALGVKGEQGTPFTPVLHLKKGSNLHMGHYLSMRQDIALKDSTIKLKEDIYYLI